ncbi:MAG: hypothetical protein ACTSU5_21180 [Promethearchaeota archaeon]
MDSSTGSGPGRLGTRGHLFPPAAGQFSRGALDVAAFLLAWFELTPVLRNAPYLPAIDFTVDAFLWLAIVGLVLGVVHLLAGTWVGELATALAHVLAFFPYNELVLHQFDELATFPFALAVGLAVLSAMLVGFALNVLDFFVVAPLNHARKGGKSAREAVAGFFRGNRKRLAVAVAVVAAASVPIVAATTPAAWNVPITVQPRDYQAEIAFWGLHDPANYTDAQKAALDRHGVTIVHFDTIDVQNATLAPVYVSRLEYWRDNYPRVRFMAAIPAPRGGFVWDGESAGTIKLAEAYITLAREHNLTNFVGVSFDWEKPQNPTRLAELGIDVAPNATRHAESRKLWNEFFTWKEANAPGMRTEAVNYVKTSLDVHDGDDDLQVLLRYDVFDVPFYDSYAPMVYRGDCSGTKPYGDVPRWEPGDAPDDPYWFYGMMEMHAKAVERAFGDRTRLGVYLGITNCTCYGSDVEQYVHGEPAGYGYDALVRDALVAKHFGAPTITLFLLNTVVDPKGYSMGGVFDSYGDDFLDRFNESINGANSTKPFRVWYSPSIDDNYACVDYFQYLVVDAFLDLNSYFGLAFAAGVAAARVLAGVACGRLKPTSGA